MKNDMKKSKIKTDKCEICKLKRALGDCGLGKQHCKDCHDKGREHWVPVIPDQYTDYDVERG